MKGGDAPNFDGLIALADELADSIRSQDDLIKCFMDCMDLMQYGSVAYRVNDPNPSNWSISRVNTWLTDTLGLEPGHFDNKPMSLLHSYIVPSGISQVQEDVIHNMKQSNEVYYYVNVYKHAQTEELITMYWVVVNSSDQIGLAMSSLTPFNKRSVSSGGEDGAA